MVQLRNWKVALVCSIFMASSKHFFVPPRPNLKARPAQVPLMTYLPEVRGKGASNVSNATRLNHLPAPVLVVELRRPKRGQCPEASHCRAVAADARDDVRFGEERAVDLPVEGCGNMARAVVTLVLAPCLESTFAEREDRLLCFDVDGDAGRREEVVKLPRFGGKREIRINSEDRRARTAGAPSHGDRESRRARHTRTRGAGPVGHGRRRVAAGSNMPGYSSLPVARRLLRRSLTTYASPSEATTVTAVPGGWAFVSGVSSSIEP